jgi:eukaryotic-like serine/threonine-protein kinase
LGLAGMRVDDAAAAPAIAAGELCVRVRPVSDDLLGGRYRLDSVLGRGGVATVWRARDTRLDRLVAVKVLNAPALTDPSAVQRFDREARAVARLTDPHVVGIYDAGVDDDRHYLVMELVEGTSLAALLAAGPLDPARAVGFAVQVCDAREAAHTAGVVHRDIKPATS